MVLYHVISTYQLLSVMVHRMLHHPGERAVLMICENLTAKFPQYKRLSAYFDDIAVFPLFPPIAKGTPLEEGVRRHYDAFLSERGLSLAGFDVIYVACAHYYFGIYLAQIRRPFVFFEDAAGLLSRPEILEEIKENKTAARAKYVVQYGLYSGQNDCVSKIICNMNAQIKGFYDEKAEHFDVVEEIMGLPEAEKSDIVSFFSEVSAILVPEDSVLILTQHFANLKILSFEDQCLIYQMLADYFFENEVLVFKPHPDDILYYPLLFPEAQVIRERFPSELLPMIFPKRPKTVATISSTGMHSLSPYFESTVSFDTQYEKDFKMTHRYYAALRLLEALAPNPGFYALGANRHLLSNLARCAGFGLELPALMPEDDIAGIPAASVMVIDDVSLCPSLTRGGVVALMEESPPASGIIFINSARDYCFYDIAYKELADCLVPIRLRKTARGSGEDFHSSLTDETIYFYSKDRGYRDMAESLSFEKELKHTQINISAGGGSPEQARIQVLEGILEATEKRLLHYIRREKELEEELEKYRP